MAKFNGGVHAVKVLAVFRFCGTTFCAANYERILPILAAKLSCIHNVIRSLEVTVELLRTVDPETTTSIIGQKQIHSFAL